MSASDKKSQTGVTPVTSALNTQGRQTGRTINRSHGLSDWMDTNEPTKQRRRPDHHEITGEGDGVMPGFCSNQGCGGDTHCPRCEPSECHDIMHAEIGRLEGRVVELTKALKNVRSSLLSAVLMIGDSYATPGLMNAAAEATQVIGDLEGAEHDPAD